MFFFFKTQCEYELRIRDWSSYVCSSDLLGDKRRLLPCRPDCGNLALGLLAAFIAGGEVSARRVRALGRQCVGTGQKLGGIVARRIGGGLLGASGGGMLIHR